MQRISEFLDAMPSRQAASAFILAIKISVLPLAKKIGLKQIDHISKDI